MSIRDFLLGVAASYIAAILFSYVQPYVIPFLSTKLLQLIRLPILRVRQATSNRAFAYASAGYADGTSSIILFISTIMAIYFALTLLPPITRPISVVSFFEISVEIIMAFILVLLAYIFMYLASIITAAIHLDRYFKWRLAIIALCISLKEEKEIKAMWALMKNRPDYEQINRKLNSLAEINGIVLPEPFLNVLKI
jgi:hypothetical protein